MGGGGGTHQSFIRGGSAPRSRPLPFYIPFLIGKVPLSYTFRRKLYPFYIPTECLLPNVSLQNPLKNSRMNQPLGASFCSRYFGSPFSYLNGSFLNPFLYLNCIIGSTPPGIRTNLIENLQRLRSTTFFLITCSQCVVMHHRMRGYVTWNAWLRNIEWYQRQILKRVLVWHVSMAWYL